MPQINGITPARAPMATRPAPRALPGVARESVRFGQVFRRYNADGVTLGDKLYGSIGNNGRFYSISLKSNDIAAADDGAARVKVVGSFELTTQLRGKTGIVAKKRGNVADTELFRVKGGKKLYAHVGRLNDGRYLALNPQSQDYALSPPTAGNKNVEALGTYAINVVMNHGEKA